MAATASSTAVPEGFHYETTHVILSYLGLSLPSRPQGKHLISTEGGSLSYQESDGKVWKSRGIQGQIEEELCKLEEEISTSFSSTGFDCRASPVFSPANPESSIQMCLAALGDHVAQTLETHLNAILQTLISAPLDYDGYRAAVQELTNHAGIDGWNKVVVPLVLLQALQEEGLPLATLLPLGVRYLEEIEANYIHQLGGWGTVINPKEKGDPGAVVADNGTDIYILSREQLPDQLSPPTSLLGTGDGSSPRSWQTESLELASDQFNTGTVINPKEEEDPGTVVAENGTDICILSREQLPDQLSPTASLQGMGDGSGLGSGSWQTESLPTSLSGHESWAQVGIMDPEDAKSLDSNDGVALVDERSEYNSSNSDIVHVEQEEVEPAEDGASESESELEVSVLGSNSEPAELRAYTHQPTESDPLDRVIPLAPEAPQLQDRVIPLTPEAPQLQDTVIPLAPEAPQLQDTIIPLAPEAPQLLDRVIPLAPEAPQLLDRVIPLTPEAPQLQDTIIPLAPEAPQLQDTVIPLAPEAPQLLDRVIPLAPEAPQLLDRVIPLAPEAPQLLDTVIPLALKAPEPDPLDLVIPLVPEAPQLLDTVIPPAPEASQPTESDPLDTVIPPALEAPELDPLDTVIPLALEAPEPLVCLGGSVIEEMPPSPLKAVPVEVSEPQLIAEPEPPVSVSAPSPAPAAPPAVLESLPSVHEFPPTLELELQPEPIVGSLQDQLPLDEAQQEPPSEILLESSVMTTAAQGLLVTSAEETLVHTEPAPLESTPLPQELPITPGDETPVHTEPAPPGSARPSKLPRLLYSSAALVAIAAMMAYGALACRRK